MNPLPPFAYHRPTSLAEACALLAAPGALALAGGTDLMVHLRTGRRTPDTVVSLGRIAELDGIAHTADGGLRIGARTSLHALLAHPTVAARYPVLGEAVRYMGSPAIRHQATVGGNCCNASPAADLPPPLIALDAQAEIAGPSGRRTLPLAAFFTGPGTTALAPGELLAAVIVPPRGDGWRTEYVRLDARRAMDIAIVSAAAALRCAGGTVREVRLVLGAVAPVPLRVETAEAALAGRALDAEGVNRAAAAAMAAARPISDLRASAEYRRAMVGVLVRRALRACAPERGDG